MIHYSLTKDRMNPEKGGYIAKVSQWAKTDLDDIMDYMVAEGTGLTRPQALAYFEKLMQSVEHFIEIRGGITTPLFRIQTTISGVFRNKGDKFDPQRHRLNLRIEPGLRLRDLKSRLKLEKENNPERTPSPELFIDSRSETENKSATPQSMAILKGHDLKFDPKDLRQGIFFVPENGTDNIRVNFYSIIRSNEIIFLVPPMPQGNYTIVVQAIMRMHKSVRGGALQRIITVS